MTLFACFVDHHFFPLQRGWNHTTKESGSGSDHLSFSQDEIPWKQEVFRPEDVVPLCLSLLFSPCVHVGVASCAPPGRGEEQQVFSESFFLFLGARFGNLRLQLRRTNLYEEARRSYSSEREGNRYEKTVGRILVLLGMMGPVRKHTGKTIAWMGRLPSQRRIIPKMIRPETETVTLVLHERVQG